MRWAKMREGGEREREGRGGGEGGRRGREERGVRCEMERGMRRR